MSRGIRERWLVAIAWRGLLTLAVVGCGPSEWSQQGGDREARPHLILISLDTTRADHLGCYGREDARTPNLDALAAEGVRFADVTTVAATTLASHTSILTGVHPQTHGVPENGFRVHPQSELLTEILRQEGYRTAAFVGSFALARRFGLDQGFDHYNEDFDLLLDPRHYDQNQRRAASVTDAVLDFFDRGEPGDKPLFLFAHFFDPHAPYDPPPAFEPGSGQQGATVGGPRARRGSPADLEEIRQAARRQQIAATGVDHGGLQVVYNGLTREILEKARGEPIGRDTELAERYAGEIAYLDSEVGRLLNGLAERGILEHAVVGVFGDHGETHWEHGDFWNHGLALYDTTVRVPLLLRLPEGRSAGVVVRTPVSTIDLMPTLLELFDLPGPRGLEGVSLVPALTGGELERGPIFTIATHPAGQSFHPPGLAWRNALKARAIRDGRFKLIRTPYLDFTELYDLESDPGERENLLAEPTPEIRAVAERLGRQLEAWNRSADPLPAIFSREDHAENRKRLAALGYL